MKKLLILAVMTVGAVLGAVAQDGGNKRVRVSAHAGIGAARWVGSDTRSLYRHDFDGKFAYRVGVGLDIPIGRTWGFRTGLDFEGLGMRLSASTYEKIPGESDYVRNDYDCSASPLYLEVPLMATARVYDGEKLGIVLNFGPYVGVGVGGKVTLDGVVGDEDVSWSEKIYEDGSTFRRFDMGLGFGVGFEVKRFVFSMDSRFGLLHVSEGVDIYNCATFFGVGYKF